MFFRGLVRTGRLVLVTGGSRSGKSEFAESLLAEREPVAYLATARVEDEEMAARVARHRLRRPAGWRTVEAADNLPEALAAAAEPWALVDCFAIWIAGLLEHRDPPAAVREGVQSFLAACGGRAGGTVVVTQEVGLGVVPPYPAGRLYRDLLGEANQTVAAQADEVYLVVAGLPLRLKG